VTRKALPRRTFLRGAGVTLALPLLDAMVPALTAASKTAAKPVPRLGYFYNPNGMSMGYWTPKTIGKDFEFTPILKPLEPFRDSMTVISGLNNYPSTMGAGGGVHTRACAAWMTGVLAKPTEGADVKLAKTADQYAARVLGRDTRLESLEISVERQIKRTGNCEYNYSCLYEASISWRTPTVPNPAESNPRVVFERLFGEEVDSEARIRRIRSDKSILDNVTHELSGLKGALGGNDRRTLEEYLTAVRDLERQIQKTETSNASTPVPDDRPVGVPETFDEHVSLMFDLLFLAYQADLTRVATYPSGGIEGGGPGTYPWIGVPEQHHETSHHQNNPEKLMKLSKINTYHVNNFSRFVEKMAKTQDGDGTLLDHSFLLYGAGMSDADLHSPLDLPLVLVGAGCGTVKGNRHLKYADDKRTPMTNLHITLLRRAGVEMPDNGIGDSTGELADL
jgi:hypothetical protein